MKIFLDDLRSIPEGYIGIRPDNLPMFYMFARNCGPDDLISFDHDLGLDPDGKEYPNGNQILMEIEKQVAAGIWWAERGMPEIVIHSANNVGRMNMEATIGSIQRLLLNEN